MLYAIKGVEIFSTGTWNGDEYTQDDLDEMVRAFEDTQETCKPSLKLGHTDDQTLLQKDGLPAAGWIGSLYRKGGKLLADFVDIPKTIYELITNKAYRNVSAEIYWNADVNGEIYKRMLAAVALLGADMPAVSNLKDILSLYRKHLNPESIKSYTTSKDALIIRRYTHARTTDESPEESTTTKKEPEHMKTEAELKLEYDLKAQKEKSDAAESELKKMREEKTAQEKELKEAREYRSEAQKKEEDLKKQLAEKQIETDLDKLSSQKLVTPAMKPYIKALLGDEKKEYSLTLEGGEKKLSKTQLITEALKLLSATKSTVNFKESSKDTHVGEGPEGGRKSEADIHMEIEQYATQNKVSYRQAYVAVTKKYEKQLKAKPMTEEGSGDDAA